jgi:putative transcriptional regulator
MDQSEDKNKGEAPTDLMENSGTKGNSESTSQRQDATQEESGPDSLEGQMLIAMPGMADPRFEKSVVYICAHTSDGGAMGIIVNKTVEHISFPELLSQLNIDKAGHSETISIQFGGPVDTGRGFVLHSSDYCVDDSTINIDQSVGLTATIDILRAIARGDGPRQSMLALGYAGWAPGQLESEILENGWLHCAADSDLLFGEELGDKWTSAISKLGIDLTLLSGAAGNA